jgi:membrane-bound lytic murein transglycosylase D
LIGTFARIRLVLLVSPLCLAHVGVMAAGATFDSAATLAASTAPQLASFALVAPEPLLSANGDDLGNFAGPALGVVAPAAITDAESGGATQATATNDSLPTAGTGVPAASTDTEATTTARSTPAEANPATDTVPTPPAASNAGDGSASMASEAGSVGAPTMADPAPGVPAGATVLVDLGVDSAQSTPEDRDLWRRIRRGFKMPDLTNRRAQASTRWYAGQPDYIARMTTRASMYLFHIVEEIEKRGMPTELALLPFIESGMQPEAVSFAKAAGLWQFIPSTGKVYSLEQNLWKDERFGVIESTRAALDYLQKLYAEFGDWQLALAAYNCGEAGVERALARARAAHRSVAYQDLRLPNETLYYVPKLQAIKNIVADPQRFGIALPNIANEPYFVAFNKLLDIDVATAARLADMPIEDFRALNPAFNRPLIVGASSPTILVPTDKADTFEANLAAWQATGQPLASWTAYTLQPGEVLTKVAERVGLTEAQLRVANHIPARYRPANGSTILIPRDETTNDDIAPGFVQASFSLVPEGGGRMVTYRVRRGDTLASVARRWHVNADDIVAWNQLHSMVLFTGQRLSLTAGRPVAVSLQRHSSKKKRSIAANGASAKAETTTSAASRTAAHAAAASVPSRM